MATPGGYQNINLPSVFGNIGDALDKSIALKENRREYESKITAQREERKQRLQDQYTGTNLKNLNDVVGDLKVPLGNDYANQVSAREATKVYEDLIGMVGTLDPTNFDYQLKHAVDNLVNWENKFKQDLQFTDKYTTDVLSKNTNLDPARTKEVAKSALENKYFEQDENGQWVRKHPDNIVDNQNPVSFLTDPRMQGELAIGGENVLKDFIQGQKLHNEDYSKYASNKGFVNSNTYDIGRSDLFDLGHDERGNPTLNMRTEDFQLRNGQTLRMLPQTTWQEMYSDPKVASAIEKIWKPNRERIEEVFARGGNAIDAKSEEMLKRDFIRKTIEDGNWDLSHVNTKEKTVVPKPPSIRVTVNNGGGKDGVFTQNLYDKIRKGVEDRPGKYLQMNLLDLNEQKAILDNINANRSADEKYTSSDVYFAEQNGEIYVVDASTKQAIAPISGNTDLLVNTSQKQKQKILKGNSGGAKKPSKKYDPLGIF